MSSLRAAGVDAEEDFRERPEPDAEPAIDLARPFSLFSLSSFDTKCFLTTFAFSSSVNPSKSKALMSGLLPGVPAPAGRRGVSPAMGAGRGLGEDSPGVDGDVRIGPDSAVLKGMLGGGGVPAY